ncbi:MAG: DEAD/DEAH box helicase [Sporichthyaceae bacterium]
MTGIPLRALDVAGLRKAVGAATFARGVAYAETGAVLSMGWLEREQAVVGSVRGGGTYLANVFVRATPGGPTSYLRGECSCPMRWDCKHAVALALAAALPEPTVGGAANGPAPEARPWDAPWEALLEEEPAPWAPARTVPLAVELSLKRPIGHGWTARQEPGLQVWARLLREGRQGWVSSGLSWGRLANLSRPHEYEPAQVQVLQDLHALYIARTASNHGHLRYGDERLLELSVIGSTALLPLLEEACRAGVRLLRGPAIDLPPIEPAHMCLDVRAGDGPRGPLNVTAVLRRGEAEDPRLPLAFLSDGGAAVVVEPAASRRSDDPAEWPWCLVSFPEPVPAAVRRMALRKDRMHVPVAARDRFLTEYFPRLSRLVPVVSGDGSFDLPDVAPPVLRVRADFAEDHRLSLRWEWVYRVGEAERLVGVDAPDDGTFRDRAAEQAVLASMDSGTSSLGQASQFPRELRGMDTMRFATEWLPLLRDAEGILLEVEGSLQDYREVGDSLRIGVSATSSGHDGDWYDLGISITVEDETVPFLDVFLALAAGQSHLLLPGGGYFSLEKPELFALRELIEEARALTDVPDGPLRINRYQTSLWEQLEGLGVVDAQAEEWKRQVEGLRQLEAPGSTAVPACVQAQLRPYQIEGFEWLAFLWRHRLGGILADDMGLGKTLQTLALIAHAREQEPDAPPFLIVAPTSVVSNWAAEAARFVPTLRVVAITETAKRSARRGGHGPADVARGADVVVTSYALVRIDEDAYREQAWSGLLLDEAQFVKNYRAAVHQAARKIEAPFKLAITGTPLENSVMELWSLLSITAPGLFPYPGAFKEFFATPIERNADAEVLALLRRRIRPLVKRRTKEQVAPELPPKQEQVLEVPLEPAHRRHYDLVLARERQKVLKLLADLDGNRFQILRSLTLLRQTSLHPGLVEDEHRTMPSAKIDALLAHLDAVAGTGHRTLVFSQFTGLLDLIQDRLRADGVEHCRLDGATRNRGEVIAEFKTGTAPVFLISLKAGGFGLNLTEADYCFLMDPWWNPAAEAQAVDRTHRIGQTRPVMVYRLVAADTIEARVMALKERKAALFSGVLDGGDGFGQKFDAEDIRGLFG